MWVFLLFVACLYEGIDRFCSKLSFKDVCIASSFGKEKMPTTSAKLSYLVTSSSAWSSKLGMGASLLSACLILYIQSLHPTDFNLQEVPESVLHFHPYH